MSLRAVTCRCVPFAVALSTLGCDPNLPVVADEIPAVSRDFRPVGPAEENESSSLLQTYAGRPALDASEAESWVLPYQSKRIGVALLIAAAHGRLSELRLVLSSDATWGLPDRRRIGATPVFGDDDGRAFMHALRRAAQRFPSDATWTSKPVPPSVAAIQLSGAEPMWTFWKHGQDSIVLRIVMVSGHARIDYVGLWKDEPQPEIDVTSYGRPPPFTPPTIRRTPTPAVSAGAKPPRPRSPRVPD